MEKEAGYILPSSDSECGRLERQAALYGGTSFLDPFLEERPALVLDVGCGTGYFSRHAAMRLPSSEVVGVDMDGPRLAFARSHDDYPNSTYVAGDMGAKLPFDDGTFDLVFARLVLVHAKDPSHAMAEMARVARPGGRIVAYDMVHDGIWFSPEKPAFARLLAQVVLELRSWGMEPSQGLHLGPCMIRAGLRDVKVEVVPHHALATEPLYAALRQNWVETISGISQIMHRRFDAGLVAEAGRELLSDRGDEFLLELSVLAHGRKPG